MRDVDGFVLPVPKKNLEAYGRMAQKAGRVWRSWSRSWVLPAFLPLTPRRHRLQFGMCSVFPHSSFSIRLCTVGVRRRLPDHAKKPY
jgi:hypothetical protein